jgi:hypothetical protein
VGKERGESDGGRERKSDGEKRRKEKKKEKIRTLK